MSDAKAVILHLGRAGSMGERRRVESWSTMLTAAGAQVTTVGLLAGHSRRPVPPSPSDMSRILRGLAVPEMLAWSPASVVQLLERLRPRVLVCVSARAFHPTLVAHAGVTVLDFVDSLARSYSDRGRLSHGWRRLGFAALSRAHRRFEVRPSMPGVRRVAAGWRDAGDLRAEWVPILAPPGARVASDSATRDLVFFGNLSYPPNVAAVGRLARVWPAVQRRRPGTTALVAGATPNAEVRRLAALHGWELEADFADLRATCGRARIAVAPLDHTAGIQIKVLEAAAMGIAQVVTPAALEGMAPGFPATVAGDDAALVDGVCGLLDDDVRRAALTIEAERHVHRIYGVERWAPWATTLLAAKWPMDRPVTKATRGRTRRAGSASYK